MGKHHAAGMVESSQLGTGIARLAIMMQTPRKQALEGLRILAVEDHPDLRDLLTVLLEQQGAEVIGCESACEAFDVLVSGESLDAAVFDISMPEEDGLTLLGRWRAWEARRTEARDARRLPVIALTAHVTQEMERLCRAAGFDHYLPKPVSPTALFKALRHLATLH